MNRYRNLRRSPAIRDMVAETSIGPANILTPLFIVEGKGTKEEISSMPNYYRYSLDTLEAELQELDQLGLRSVLLFVKVPDKKKNDKCSEALNPKGLMIQSVQMIRKKFPHFTIMTDVALDPFSPHGHDGLVKNQEILNDETVDILTEMSLLHAEAGVDFVAPSDMMDGRIGAIRDNLEENGFTKTGILAYSAKYASCYYGPFRDALDSAPGFGDKKTYQMDYRNRREAIKEVVSDVEEGADIVMVKPAGAYLDIIREVRDAVDVPVAAYQVSGEYSMIKASAKAGWIDEENAILESLMAIRRAGADIIATYYGKDLVRILSKT
ncbi:MAG: porphobilinogen synthase [Leptospira sp.]|nr:porphobilinogen synthase [Leptospira sp.]